MNCPARTPETVWELAIERRRSLENEYFSGWHEIFWGLSYRCRLTGWVALRPILCTVIECRGAWRVRSCPNATRGIDDPPNRAQRDRVSCECVGHPGRSVSRPDDGPRSDAEWIV
jgi:hypothetical protein